MTGSPDKKQEQVFASYVQRMLIRRNTNTRYTRRQTIHWLSYLAGQMKQKSQTVFYIEHMQPDWLSGTRMIPAYEWWAVRLPGVLVGILISLAISTLLIPVLTFATFGASILLGGLIGRILSEGSTTQQPIGNSGKVRSIRRQQFLQRLLVGILIGLGVGFIIGLSYMLHLWLLTGLSRGLSAGLSAGLRAGLSAGFLVFLLKGGLASLRHYVLRFLLWRSGAIPWNYPRFLDNAAEQILLRKVGGGYIFLHRLLLDYFADLETGSDSNVLAEGRK